MSSRARHRDPIAAAFTAACLVAAACVEEPSPRPPERPVATGAAGTTTASATPPVPASAAPDADLDAAPPPVVENHGPPPSEGQIWIPGRWSWSTKRGTYLWIRGLWVLPETKSEPPPERRENEAEGAPPAPTVFWSRGYWAFRGADYLWVHGHWERSRPGFEYLPPHWERDGARWRFVLGVWRPR